MTNNGTGQNNVAIGVQAIGLNSLSYSNSGDYNIAIGYQSIFNNSTGHHNFLLVIKPYILIHQVAIISLLVQEH